MVVLLRTASALFATAPSPRAMLATLLLSWTGVAGATVCNDLCPGLPTPCTVTSIVNVTPGSIIDCGTRPVQVSNGLIRVTDGTFTLKAGSLSVSNSKRIETICTGATPQHGFRIETSGAITISGGGTLKASCSVGGGSIIILAASASIGGSGIDAGGTSTTGSGGIVRIVATGSVTTTAAIEADTTASGGSGVQGGAIDIRADSITIGNDLAVSGYKQNRGQSIYLRSANDITVSGGVVDADTSSGDGGTVRMRAGGAITVNREIRTSGVGATSEGGFVELVGNSVAVTRDIVARGGERGGIISIEARKRISIGSGATSDFVLDADRASNNAGAGGEIVLASEGHDVYVSPQAWLHADAPAGGEGGTVSIAGVDVFLATSSKVTADGSSGQGGRIEIEARGAMTLNGLLHATNGEAEFTWRATSPSIGGGVTGTWIHVQDDSLYAACGDGVRRDPSEACDAPDMGAQTCCTETCTGC